MNAPLALQFEATDFMDPVLLYVLIGTAFMLVSAGVGITLDKYNRINFTALNAVCTVFAAFSITVLVGCIIVTVNNVESPTDKRINNIEKAYEGVEVIDFTYGQNKERVVTLLTDGQTVTATLREDPDTFEPTLYPYASENAVKLEKVSSE